MDGSFKRSRRHSRVHQVTIVSPLESLHAAQYNFPPLEEQNRSPLVIPDQAIDHVYDKEFPNLDDENVAATQTGSLELAPTGTSDTEFDVFNPVQLL